MSNFLTISQTTGGLPGSAPRLFTASTNDTLAAITTAGYVADKVATGNFNVRDVLIITYDVDGTPGQGIFNVTSTSSGSLVAWPAAIGGALLAANNLDDVALASTARTNLELGTGNSPTFTGVTASGYFYASTADALTAFAGGGQASATQLAKAINRVTIVATAGDSVKLPVSAAGMGVVVINASANAMDVFPSSGQAINALAADTAISVAANKTIKFYCAVTGTWNSILTA